jgi:hypothetical protein
VTEDETPTRPESSEAQRVEVFRHEALRLALLLDDGGERELAGRARMVAETFDAWTRGEATREQQSEDVARWRDLVAAAREKGVAF